MRLNFYKILLILILILQFYNMHMLQEMQEAKLNKQICNLEEIPLDEIEIYELIPEEQPKELLK